MATSQTRTQDREAQSRKEMLSIVREIADVLAYDSTQITETYDSRDDMVGYEIEHPINHARVAAKRNVTSDGWGYVWDRIQVEIEHKSISMARIQKIKREHNLEITDVWQTRQNLEAEMGQHDNPAISFAMKPRK